MQSVCPTTGEVLANVRTASPAEVQETLAKTREAYVAFRSKHLLALLWLV